MQAVLLGYYTIPEASSGIHLVLNPPGAEARLQLRPWNAGDGRCKLLVLLSAPEAKQGMGMAAERADAQAQAALVTAPAAAAAGSGAAAAPTAALVEATTAAGALGSREICSSASRSTAVAAAAASVGGEGSVSRHCSSTNGSSWSSTNGSSKSSTGSLKSPLQMACSTSAPHASASSSKSGGNAGQQAMRQYRVG